MSHLFPECRHRREPRSRWTAMCRSSKVTGLRMVSPAVCHTCPFVDHHFPGDGSESADDVHPEMPVERLIESINGPPRIWPEGWGDWDVTHRAHQLAADRFLTEIGDYPEGRFQGRGIVIAGGGAAYFPSLYVTVRAIRHVGCSLPIEVWYLGRDNELPPDRRRILERYGVECVDADAVRERHPCRILNGWELKVYAVLHSRFEEVLSLDADSYPVRDPAFLFDEAGYRNTGAVFWPDMVGGPSPNWGAFGVPPPGRVSIETGQFVVDKRACWRPLQLAWWYCDHSDWSFLHGYGDKGALEAAWPVCGRGYTMYRDHVEWSVHSFLQSGPDLNVLFVHRCGDKFRFGPAGYMTPQPHAANRFNRELPLETECFSWFGQLRGILATGHDSEFLARRSTPLIRAFIYTCPERREVFEGTLARWRATDWGEDPVIVTDDGTGPTSTERHIRTAHRMLITACDHSAEYYLFLENDLLFNLYLRQNLTTWQPLRDRSLWMGSLYNPGFGLMAPADGEGGWNSRTAHPVHGEYYGSQAIVLSRSALEVAVKEWDSEPGNLDLRLANIALRYSPAVALHVPSLVQHLPVPSTWNGPPHRAIDFDPFFRA